VREFYDRAQRDVLEVRYVRGDDGVRLSRGPQAYSFSGFAGEGGRRPDEVWDGDAGLGALHATCFSFAHLSPLSTPHPSRSARHLRWRGEGVAPTAEGDLFEVRYVRVDDGV